PLPLRLHSSFRPRALHSSPTRRSSDLVVDELYSACMRTRGSVVLATAYCDPSKPQGTGMDEAVVWVNKYGNGRVVENVLGHNTQAMADKNYQEWVRRGVEWAATGQVESASK